MGGCYAYKDLIRKFKYLSKLLKVFNIISSILSIFMFIAVIVTVIEELSVTTDSVTVIGNFVSCVIVFTRVVYLIYRLMHFRRLNQKLMYVEKEDESVISLKQLYTSGLYIYDKFIAMDVVFLIVGLLMIPADIVTNLCIAVNIYQTIKLNKMSLSVREHVTKVMVG